MKTIFFASVFLMTSLLSCNSQGKGKEKSKDELEVKPHEDISVNRKYDKDGNDAADGFIKE